jgi:hypothetical protein
MAAFCKAWLLMPRDSAEKLLLLEHTWSLVSACGASPLIVSPEALVARGDWRPGGGGGTRGKGAPRLQESPVAQLCMSLALEELRVAPESRLAQRKLALKMGMDEQEEEAGGGGEAPEGAEASEAAGDAGKAADVSGGQAGSDGRESAGAGASGDDLPMEVDAGGAIVTNGKGDGNPDPTEVGAAGDGAAVEGHDGQGSSSHVTAIDEESRARVYEALATAFRNAKLGPADNEQRPIAGADGWLVRFKPRARPTALQAGDVYLTSPAGATIDSLRKARGVLGMDADDSAGATLAARREPKKKRLTALEKLRNYTTSPTA